MNNNNNNNNNNNAIIAMLMIIIIMGFSRSLSGARRWSPVISGEGTLSSHLT